MPPNQNGNSLNINSPSNTYITATIFSLAHSYGTPTILSSYSYSTTDDGAPNGGAGTCSTTGGANGWLCQHRFVAITGMVGFRNQVGTSAITNWVSPQSQQIAFGRGTDPLYISDGERLVKETHRLRGLRRDQQRGLGVVHDIHDVPSQWGVLRCD
jgi:hypothetical protein